MNYIVHTNVEKLVNEMAGEMPAFVSGADEYYEGFCSNVWRNFTRGRKGQIKSTEEVVKEFFGGHEAEASAMSATLADIRADGFFKKQFKFCNKQMTGCRVDIPRYLNGDQRCWFAVKKIRAETKAVRVYAPMGGLWNVTANMMKVCGALAVAVCELLESRGINVELWAACGIRSFFYNKPSNVNDCDWTKCCQMLKIKDSSQYTDLGLVNYICGNSDFYRNIIWKSRVAYGIEMHNISKDWKANVDASYASTNFQKEYLPNEGDDKSDIVIPRIYQIETASEWLKNFAKRNQNEEE